MHPENMHPRDGGNMHTRDGDEEGDEPEITQAGDERAEHVVDVVQVEPEITQAGDERAEHVVQVEPEITQAGDERAEHVVQVEAEITQAGYFFICGESRKLLSTRKRFFCQITLTVILPFSLFLFFKRYMVQHYHHLSTLLLGLNILHCIVFVGFWVLATSSVVLRSITLVDGNTSTKRILITLLCGVIAILAYYAAFLFTVGLWEVLYYKGPRVTKVGERVMWVFLIGYFMGLVYLLMVWQLAAVITVVEDVKGFQAMLRGRRLMRGKLKVGALMSLKFMLSLVAIFKFFDNTSLNGSKWKALGCGGVSVVLLTMVVLFQMVVQTVIYRVCKSHHNNNNNNNTSAGATTSLKDYAEMIYWATTICITGTSS